MKASLGEKVFWTVIALSSIGCAIYGYERFKLIRPDLFGQPTGSGVAEKERAARIAEYQQKGDALTRAGNQAPASTPSAGKTTCANGVLVEIARGDGKVEAKAVMVDGKPVHCATGTAPTIP